MYKVFVIWTVGETDIASGAASNKKREWEDRERERAANKEKFSAAEKEGRGGGESLKWLRAKHTVRIKAPKIVGTESKYNFDCTLMVQTD